MRFSKIKCQYFHHAKSITTSQNLIVCCTGSSIVVLDKNLNLKKRITGLYYVYKAEISPDEKNILLISNSNKFYIISLDNFEVTKYSVKGKYNNNLEGRGCWSLTGDSIIILPCNKYTHNSVLRCYNSSNMEYVDMLDELFWLIDIKPVKSLGKYLIIGLNREKAMSNCRDAWNMIWFDGKQFDKYPLYELHDDVVMSAEYNHCTKNIIVYGMDKTIIYHTNGIKEEKINLPDEKELYTPFNNFTTNDISNNDCLIIEEFAKLYGIDFKNVSINNRINKICISSNGSYCYIATQDGLLVVDAVTKEIIEDIRIEFGVQNILEISANIIMLSTFNGLKLFEII